MEGVAKMSMQLALQLADRLAAEILASVDICDDQLTDIDEIAVRLGVSFFSNDSLRTEGRVVRTVAGPIVEYNSRRPLARQRFTKAHELIHWWTANPATSSLTAATQAAFHSEEEMCDSVGAALLLPRRWLDAHAGDVRVVENQTMDTLGAWATHAGVSREAVVIRFRDVFAWRKILLTWEKTHKEWRYTGECGVRPWENGRIRPEANVATDHLPQAAGRNGVSLQPHDPLGLIIDGAWDDVRAELAVEGGAGYALIDNPFLRVVAPEACAAEMAAINR
jgi:Zn-dependent peptidase ImmA (M78 family)